MRDQKRVNLLKKLLERELTLQQPSLIYVEDLQLSIERAKKEVAYEMIEGEVGIVTANEFYAHLK